METYSPGVTAVSFHTESYVSAANIDNMLDSFQTIIFWFALTAAIWLFVVIIFKQLVQRAKIKLQFNFLKTQMYIASVIVVITAIIITALTGLSIQTTSYGSAVRGAQLVRATIQSVVSKVNTTIYRIKMCEPVQFKDINKKFAAAFATITDTKGQIESYVDDAITYVNIAQMSGSFLIIMMLFVLSAGWVVYVAASVSKKNGWYHTAGLHVFAAMFSVMASLLLLLLTFQANMCMDPAKSVDNLWVIDDALLSYYIKCSLDPSEQSDVTNDINDASDACNMALKTVSSYNQSCAFTVLSDCVSILDAVKCPQLTKGLVNFTHAVCVESITAIALTFVASTLMFVSILWTIFTINLNVKELPKIP